MILSTGGKLSKDAVRDRLDKGYPVHLAKCMHNLLAALNAAVYLDDLRFPPGNRLEQLSGDRIGQYSIRINDHWRICFIWTDRGPAQVEIVDYH
ncbi:MAG: type II toxin-antitoxin system RelE/ParE family toxin [Gammaproteobacteria bacterium]|nr:type II toxin-antitoxin system RelE/ParE family toxin [Gammaproteobacteria bacterium]MCY4227348.1 type II toxin-antitoxin system RelE/ParE family toxin [Gammaproteobacteria bacterium]